jgi:hypothetical protein
MANRYWILGTGTWSSTNTVNWSASSGGAGGASVPTAADNVFFDANSNVGTTAFTVTMANSPRVCNDFTASGLDGVMTLAGISIGLTVSGSLTFQATNFTRTYTGTTTFNATTTGKTVTTNGVAFGSTVTFDGVGGGWTLGSALTNSAGSTIVTNGTFDTSSSGNYAVTTAALNSNNSNTRTINLNASTLTLSSVSNPIVFTTTTGLTFNAGTSSINCSGTSVAFAGSNLTYYNVAFTSSAQTTPSITGANTFNNLSIGGTGALTITGSNTFNDITTTVRPTSVLFTAGTTNTFTNFSLSGTAGNLVTIGSVTAASHTLSKASGTVSADYLSISRSTATGGASWYAGANSTNGGNNSGWIFTAPPAPSAGNGNFLMFF